MNTRTYFTRNNPHPTNNTREGSITDTGLGIPAVGIKQVSNVGAWERFDGCEISCNRPVLRVVQLVGRA